MEYNERQEHLLGLPICKVVNSYNYVPFVSINFHASLHLMELYNITKTAYKTHINNSKCSILISIASKYKLGKEIKCKEKGVVNML